MTDDYHDDLEEHVNDRNSYWEETAAETDWGRVDQDARIDEDDHGTVTDYGAGYGILALVLSILGFFFLPVVMGAAGIIIGFIARAKGAQAWGGWAIGLGIAAIALSLFAAPFS